MADIKDGDRVTYAGTPYTVTGVSAGAVRLEGGDDSGIWVSRDSVELKVGKVVYSDAVLESAMRPFSSPGAQAIDATAMPPWICGACGTKVDGTCETCPNCEIKLDPIQDVPDVLTARQVEMLLAATAVMVGDTAKAMPETRAGLEYEAPEWIELLQKLNVMVGLFA